MFGEDWWEGEVGYCPRVGGDYCFIVVSGGGLGGIDGG